MADVYTATGSVSTDLAAYDKMSYWALRPELKFDQFAEVQPTTLTNPGATVTFQKWTEMAAATTPLSETVDVDAVAIADSQVTVTLQEYGNAVVTTRKLHGTTHIPVNPVIANLLGYNAGLSIDTIARNAVQAGTNVRYGGAATTRATVAAAHTLTAANVRRARAELVAANVQTFDGQYYAAVIHPDVALDLRTETGAASWRDPHVYSQPEQIWTGEIGAFEGFRFIESSRAPVFVDAGVTSTVDVYRTIFMGRQAIAKAFSTAAEFGPNPRIRPGPVVDKLQRFQPLGWYHFVGYGIFRQEAIRAVESSSSIATN